MNINRRIKKLERLTGVDDKYCRCGTPYFITFVIGGEDITRDACPDCGRDIKPITRADFANIAFKFNYEYEVIEPTVDENEML